MTTTFSSVVRSNADGGFSVVKKDTSTGAETIVARSQMVGYATGVTVNSTAGDSPAIGEWTQPAGTLITAIDIWCVVAPVIATGDIGYEVGTSSSGTQIVAAQTDEIIDGGTTATINSVAQTTLVQVTQDDTTFAVSAQYAGSERTIYCNITNVGNASTAGSFTFVITYLFIGPTT